MQGKPHCTKYLVEGKGIDKTIRLVINTDKFSLRSTARGDTIAPHPSTTFPKW